MGKKVIGAVLVIVGIVIMVYTSDTTVFQIGLMMFTAGLSIMAAAMLGPVPNANRRKIKWNQRTNVEPRKLIYGNTMVAGPLVYAETMAGEEKDEDGVLIEDFLHRIIVLAGHPIESIEEVWLADQSTDLHSLGTLSFGAGSSENWEIGNKSSLILGVTQNEDNAPDSKEAIAVRKAAGRAWASGTGSSESTNNNIISDAFAANSTRKLNDCPYLYVRLQLVEDGWKSTPSIRAEVKGKRIRDASSMRDLRDGGLTDDQILDHDDSVPYYDNNAANCLLDYLMDEKLGLGVPLGEIDLTSFGDAADLCGETVHSIDVTETIVEEGSDAYASMDVSGLADYNFELAKIRHNEINVSKFGTINLTLADGVVLTANSGYAYAYSSNVWKLKVSSGDQGDFFTGSHINVKTGSIFIRTLADYVNTTGDIIATYGTGSAQESIRYPCDGMVYLDSSPVQIVEELLTACVGRLTYTQGQYKLYPGTWETPHTQPLTEEDLAGPISIVTAMPRSDRFNAVKGVYADRNNQWELTDFPEVNNPYYKDADTGSDDYVDSNRNGYIYRDLELPFTTYVDPAIRIAKLLLDRGRQSLMLDVVCKPTALRYSPGDNIYVDLPSLGAGNATIPGFSEATFGTVNTSGGIIQSIEVLDGGSGYIYPPKLSITIGSGASVLPLINGGSIEDLLVVEGGTGYSGLSVAKIENVALFSLNLDVSGTITSVTVTDGGSGYLEPPELTTTIGTGADLLAIISEGAVVGVNVVAGGVGYTDNSKVSTVSHRSFWNNKIFKIERWAGNDDGNIEMTLREDNAAIYADGSEVFATDPGPDRSTITAPQDATPSKLRLESGINVSRVVGGKYTGGIRATWDHAEDLRNVAYYEVEIGTGIKWKKKLVSIDVEAAKLDLEDFRSPTTPATATYKWKPKRTWYSSEPGFEHLDREVFPAKIYIEITDPGSGYTLNPKYSGADAKAYYVTIDDTASGESCRVRFLINDAGGLYAARVIYRTGDFVNENAVLIPSSVMGTPEANYYKAKVNFEIEEGITVYPDYESLSTRLGPYCSYVFNDSTLESHVGGYENFYSTRGVADTETAFDPGFDNLTKCVYSPEGSVLTSEYYYSNIDFHSTTREFCVESILSIQAATDGTHTLWSIGNISNGVVRADISFISGVATNITIKPYGALASNSSVVFALTGEISLSSPFHLVYNERGSEALGGSLRSLFINGTMVKQSTETVTHDISLAPDRYTIGGIDTSDASQDTDVQFAVFNVYDKNIASALVFSAYEELDNTTYPNTDYTDIEAFTITDVEQSEFNGYKTLEDHKATMLTDTLGSFEIDKIRRVSSFIPGSDGLPGAHTGTFGPYVKLLEGDVTYAIASVTRTTYIEEFAPAPPPPARNVLMLEEVIPFSSPFNIGDTINVSGVYDKNQEEDFSGLHVVSKVITTGLGTTGLIWYSNTSGNVVSDSSAILDRDNAYLLMDHPPEFLINKKVATSEEPLATFFDGIIDDKSYLVRLRSVGTNGRVSSWITKSITADSDYSGANPVYFEGVDGESSIDLLFDFSKDATDETGGTSSITYHTETNLSHIELVVATRGTDRQTTLGSHNGLSRWIAQIPVASNVVNIENGKVEYNLRLNGEPYDYYAWARLVTKAGESSNWFPDDEGLGINFDGVGPIRGDAASYTNLVGNDNSEVASTTIDSDSENNDTGVAEPIPTTGPPDNRFEIFRNPSYFSGDGQWTEIP